jgi:hypothetical protein
MSNTILVGYSPNDFFYADADSQGIMPTKEECSNMKPYDILWDTSCNIINFPDQSGNCINKELCKNRDYVSNLYNVEQTHSGANEKYFNVKDQYDALFMNTVNLGIGCLFLGGVIIQNK